MKRKYYLLYALLSFSLLYISSSFAQPVEDSIQKVLMSSMNHSTECWNKGDLTGYMHNYWKSDSLRFMGKNGVTYGWENTLNRYLKGYPTEEKRGILEFEIKSIEYLGENCILMVGKWLITRKTEKVDGYFSLIWKKFGSEWYIVLDHSS